MNKLIAFICLIASFSSKAYSQSTCQVNSNIGNLIFIIGLI